MSLAIVTKLYIFDVSVGFQLRILKRTFSKINWKLSGSLKSVDFRRDQHLRFFVAKKSKADMGSFKLWDSKEKNYLFYLRKIFELYSWQMPQFPFYEIALHGFPEVETRLYTYQTMHCNKRNWITFNRNKYISKLKLCYKILSKPSQFHFTRGIESCTILINQFLTGSGTPIYSLD